MVDEARSVIFGRDAEAYEDARPSYPDEAITHLMSLVEARDAVEIGAGTGKATTSLASEDLDLICLEPSPQMAAILEAKDLPGVSVAITRFEDWQAEPESSDLIYAAQAWHWVDPETGFEKAMSILRPGGVLALLWNIPLDRYSRHQEAYARHAPHLLTERDERIKRRDDHDWCPDMEAAGFVDTSRFTHRWSQKLSASLYRSLYSSYSDHMMLDQPMRTLLLDELAEAVEGWGGTAEVEYRTEVFSGRKPDTDRR